MNLLLEQLIHPALNSCERVSSHDGAVLEVESGRIAYTTDSYVITPLFFPGGDIGRLSVFGTVNDLAMCGARPGWLSLGLILEEGFPMETLEKVLRSVADAACISGVRIVTGDTKVVERGKADGIYINTAGIGLIPGGVSEIGPGSITPGDAVIVSGDLGRHGMAVMSVREGLSFISDIESDLAPLNETVMNLISEGIPVKCMRDLTRGGLASALNELASSSGHGFEIDEDSIPVSDQVHAACEMLGYDPLYVANEGRMVVVVPEAFCDRTVTLLRSCSVSSGAVRIGGVVASGIVPVTIRTSLGTQRALSMISGEQLPRIC